MIDLEKKYSDKLKAIESEIQNSDLLAKYLDEEDEEFYNQLKEAFEPQIDELHNEVAQNDPLQLVSLEEHICDPMLEGLFLPRVLGYSVLRGALNDQFKYIRPQEHFKMILLAICNSSNFELLSQRIGQTVEIGFALSSDIWITNLIAEISNKHVKTFLHDLKLVKYRDIRSRHLGYQRYSRQFVKFNYLTAEKPTSSALLKIDIQSILNFLNYRASLGSDAGKSVYDYISEILSDATLGNHEEHLEVVVLIASYFDLKDEEKALAAERLDAYVDMGEEEEMLFMAVKKMQTGQLGLKEAAYRRLGEIIGRTSSVELKEFLGCVTQIDGIGYINSDAIEIARNYYNKNKGLSKQNACMRNNIGYKFKRFIAALSPQDFQEYFELNKTFTVYMNIFSNEKFNQGIKEICMKYVRTLLRTYTEKRSKDYQDIKKFVQATFVDLGFLNEKEIKELFKTKRVKSAK